ncbi:MAG TPA: ferrous iron transport protein A [Candidatus Scatomorpha merdigallinarum]|nr:ferrous iron transport protein A [Candidatus Scatomorpha merdigallinarum]
MLPLSMAGEGTTQTIVKITGKDEVRRHLAELGLVVGEEVMVVNSLAGNLILQVKESRIALDRALCTRIMVNG